MRNILASLVSVIVLAITLSTPSFAGGLGCYGEVLGGYSTAQTELSYSSLSLDGVGSDGLAGGVGLGCDVGVSPAVLVGVEATYMWSDVETEALGYSVGYESQWRLVARLGYRLSDGVVPYVLAGYGGADLDLGDLGLGGMSFTGPVVGGGVEMKLGGPWSMKAEYSAMLLDGEDLAICKYCGSIDLDPTIHTVHVGLVYRFGDLLAQPK